MSKHTVSSSVIKRLPRYYRFLGELAKQNLTRISSRELSELMGLTASQIRQDLNCFGTFGQQGCGYNVKELHDAIGNILGVNAVNKTIIIGAGNLGKAIATHVDFTKRGCRLVGIFDINPDLFGKVISGISVQNINELESFCAEHHPNVAVLCIPKTSAQELANKLVELGITGFWNFSHYDLNPRKDENIIVENVHLGDSLMVLAYNVNSLLDENCDEPQK